MTDRTGRCLCGAVTYRLKADPLTVRQCWCRECQRIAANGTINLVAPSDKLQYEGELAKFTRTAASGNVIDHHFCPKCGTQMFGSAAVRPHITIVRAGTLDDPSSVTPEVVIWVKSAPSWACFDTGLQQFDGQAPPPTVKPG